MNELKINLQIEMKTHTLLQMIVKILWSKMTLSKRLMIMMNLKEPIVLKIMRMMNHKMIKNQKKVLTMKKKKKIMNLMMINIRIKGMILILIRWII